MSAASPRQQDPSMDEILASIRRIIADDQDATVVQAKRPEPDTTEDEVLDLAELEPSPTYHSAETGTEVPELTFQEDEQPDIAASPGRIDRRSDREPSHPARLVADALPTEPPQRDVTPSGGDRTGDRGISLPNDGRGKPDALISDDATASVGRSFGLLSHTILTQNARTLEDLVGDMLKPMLRDWLDDNLPPLVERLVRMEIERVARGSR